MSAARLDPLLKMEGDRYAPLCPEFVIELRSASDRLPDVEARMEQWMANGADVAWLIDPQLKRVTVYRADQPAETHDEPAVVAGDGPMAGFELAMARIWK